MIYSKILLELEKLTVSISFLLFVATSLTYAYGGGKDVLDVGEFGARGDGTTLDTKYIQAAIDSCYRSGGGTVFFPAGRYLSGTLALKSNVFLEIGSGAIILGSTDISDYADDNLICAEGARNVGIIGAGFINGQGDFFWKGKSRPYVRPGFLIRFDDCRNVTITDISIRNSPRYNIYLRGCDLVKIHGISIINDREAPNTDGIDPSGSTNIFISNCYIRTGDDAICLKSNEANSVTSDVVVSDCILETDDSAIKCGTASRGVIRNSTFSNVVIKNSRYGIALFMKDGGKFEGLKFSNITIQTETAEYAKPGRYSFPIFIDIEKRTETSSFGQVKDISFDDIEIETYTGNCLFLGQPGHEIEGLVMNDIRMKVLKRIDFSKRRKPRGTRTLTNVEPNDYAGIASHLTFAYVNDLTVRNFIVRDDDPETDLETYFLWGKDIRNVLIDGLRTEQLTRNKTLPVIEIIDGKDMTIRNCKPDSNKVGFLAIEGKGSRNIKLIDNDLAETAREIMLGDGASKGAVVIWDERREDR